MGKSSFPEQWLQVLDKFSPYYFVVELGSQIKVLYNGGKACSYFGYPAEAFVSQIEGFFGDLIQETDRPHVARCVYEALETKADIDLQFHLICYDRTLSLIHLVGTCLYASEEGVPIYLFLLSDEKQGLVNLDLEQESFRLSFHVDTGELLEINLQARIAFLVHEFPNTYEAISIFCTRYVHPQDRTVFSAFADAKTLRAFALAKGEQKGIAFRRKSYNERFSGYQWSMLSYRVQESDSDTGVVCTLVIQDSDKTTRVLAEKTLQTQLDPLTGVLNRLALESQVTLQIALCSEKDCMGAFFMLDIDHFKWVNDTFGHGRGDQVLRLVAQAVKGVFRPTDIVARPGGDEFAVFITGIPSQELAMTKAENLCRALRSIGNSDADLQLSCSVGVSIFPDHGSTFADLYHTSDLALYQAKREGRDGFCLYGSQSLPFEQERPIDREWIFSQLEEEIYICNVDTYALLFANEALLKRLGLSAFTTKGNCYEVLHQRSTPCEGCRNLFLKKDRVSSRFCREGGDTTLFLIQEKALLLQGARVKLAVSTPIPHAWIDFLEKHISITTLESLPD